MKRRFFIVLVVLFPLFLLSCGQGGPFMPVSNMKDAVTLGVSVSPGKIVDPDTEDSIGISLTYDDNRVLPAKLEVALLDQNNTVVGTPVTIEGDALKEELPAVDTTSLDDGLYTLRLRVYDSGGQLLKETLTPFFDSRIHIQIEGIDSYPPEFAPGSSGLVFPKVDAPPAVWIRWSLGDTIISEGTLASYASGLVWNAPQEEGVYTLKMEVFPSAPPEASSYSFSSPLSSNVQIFVTKSVSPNTYDLSPGSSYTTLLNMNGNLLDNGTFHSSAKAVGDPSLTLDDGGFGYLLHQGDGVSLDTDTLPVSDGTLGPFSVTFRFKITDEQIGKYFLQIQDPRGTLFSVKTDGTGILTALLKQPSETIETSSGIDPRSATEITLSVVPLADTVLFLWYADGQLVQSNHFSYTPLQLAETHEGTTVVAGGEGFSGFIDYFGIYFRDKKNRPAVDDSIYKRFIVRSGGAESADTIEGFDGLYVPDRIAALNGDNTGISVGGGDLRIIPGGSAVVMETGTDFAELRVSAETDGAQKGAVFLFTVEKNGNHLGTADVPFSETGITSGFTAVLRGGMLQIVSSSKRKSELPFSEGDTLKISIKNENTADVLGIASLFGSRKGRKIVESKTSSVENSL